MAKIFMIESGRHMDGEWYQVGKPLGLKGHLVTEIKNSTLEYEDHVHTQYDIYVNDKIHKSWVNVPVMITYFD